MKEDNKPVNWNMGLEVIKHLSDMRREISVAISSKDFELWYFKQCEIWVTIKGRIKEDIDEETPPEELDAHSPQKQIYYMEEYLKDIRKSMSDQMAMISSSKNAQERREGFSLIYWGLFDKFLASYENLNTLLWEYDFMWPRMIDPSQEFENEIESDFEGT